MENNMTIPMNDGSVIKSEIVFENDETKVVRWQVLTYDNPIVSDNQFSATIISQSWQVFKDGILEEHVLEKPTWLIRDEMIKGILWSRLS